MAELALFQPSEALNADERLTAFVRQARDDLSVFGNQLIWNAPTWELHGVSRVSGRPSTLRVTWGHPLKKSPKSVGDYTLFDTRNIDFFKAYLRYTYGLAPRMDAQQTLSAMRHLDKALSRGDTSIAGARADDFNAASATCRSAFALETSYRVGRQLEAIARFLNDHGLVARPLNWICPIRRPTDFHRIGVGHEHNRHRKLPSEQAIAGLGEAYRRARHPMDVLAASAYALLLATHSRISELHRLDAYDCDCEVETTDHGTTRWGLRWYPSKGGQPEIRWIPTALVPLAKDALQHIRDVTEPARELARKYIAGQPILPQDDPNDPLARDGYISMETLGTVTNPNNAIAALRRNGCDLRPEFPRSLRVPVTTTARLYLRAPIEERFRAELPEGFPLADPKSRLRYDRALLVRNGDISPRSPSTFWRLSPVRSDEIERTMNGKNNREGRTLGLFERLSLVDDDGEPIRITPHQLRHYMTTLAMEGNLSELDIARWAGRSDIHHNAHYDHETADSLVAKAREVESDMFGKTLTATPQQPITAKQVMQRTSLAVHVTKFGACLHDFAMSPCPLFRDCLNCVEHACVKGDKQAEGALRDRLAIMEKAVAAAENAEASGETGSEIWLSRKRIELARLRELVVLIDDDKVIDGAVVMLNSEAHYVIEKQVPEKISSSPEKPRQLKAP